ncbi:MAG TPA: hypothetical protein VFD01_18135 [Candidatus Dormibacteraeota bacterium]|nr:hypothetical protein [Candidatus Dormibacteraeota bacterium]
MARWRWIGLAGGLVALAVLLAWIDSTALRSFFPHPLPVRRVPFRPEPRPMLPFGPGLRGLLFPRLGPVGGLYTFWWFLSVGAGAVLLALAVLVAVPARARRAVERMARAGLPSVVVAGVAALLLALAATVLMWTSFVLAWGVAFVWGLTALGMLFGLSCLALAFGRWLCVRLGPAPPLATATVALLAFFDLGLVPVLGWALLGLLLVGALGLAVLTRLGSATGWSLEELDG